MSSRRSLPLTVPNNTLLYVIFVSFALLVVVATVLLVVFGGAIASANSLTNPAFDSVVVRGELTVDELVCSANPIGNGCLGIQAGNNIAIANASGGGVVVSTRADVVFDSITTGAAGGAQALQFVSNTSPQSGIQFGSDAGPTANLYRSTSGTLQTDGILQVTPTVNGVIDTQTTGTGARMALMVLPTWNTTANANVLGAFIANNLNNSLLGTAAISTAVVNNGGTNYAIGDLLVVSGGNANSQLQVTNVDITGSILTLIITRGGSGYSAADDVSVSGGTGSNATVNVTVASASFTQVTGLIANALPSNNGYSTASINTAIGFSVGAPTLGLGPLALTNYYGIYIDTMSVATSSITHALRISTISGAAVNNIGIQFGTIGSSTITATSNTAISMPTVRGATTNTGIAMGPSTGGDSNTGIRIPEQGSGSGVCAAIYLTGITGVATGGIQWGNDVAPQVNLYRSGVGTLKSDGILRVNPLRNAATTTTAITGSTRWNQTTGTTATGVGVLGSNSLSGLQLSTNGVATFVINNGGVGYTVNDLLIVTGGSGTAQVKVTSVSSGVILTMVLMRPGSGYSVTTGVSLTGGTGVNATLDISTINTTPFTTIVGVQGQAFEATSGFVTPTVTTAIGFQTLAPVLGSGPVVVTNIIGIDVPAHAIATTNSYGLRIAAPTGGATINQAMNFVASTIAAGGITFGADATPSTNLYRSATNIIKSDADFAARKHYGVNAAIPTAVAGTGAGTGPTITVAAGSTDCKMQISVATGTLPTGGGIIMTVTYNSAFINTLNKGVTFSPAGANAALLSGATMPYVSSETLSTFVFTSGSTGLTASTTYTWNFQSCV